MFKWEETLETTPSISADFGIPEGAAGRAVLRRARGRTHNEGLTYRKLTPQRAASSQPTLQERFYRFEILDLTLAIAISARQPKPQTPKHQPSRSWNANNVGRGNIERMTLRRSA